MSSSLSMRIRAQLLTSGIRAVLSCSLNISCSSSFHAPLVLSRQQEHLLSLLIPPLLHRLAAARLRQPLPHVAAPTSTPCSKDSLSARSPRAHSTGRRPRLPATEERERVAVETAATAARLAMTELAVARAEVEAAAVADEACAAAAELETLRQ
jgi:hypothetical protein